MFRENSGPWLFYGATNSWNHGIQAFQIISETALQISPTFIHDLRLMRSNHRRTVHQVFQPMQVFALFHPEFDHYWQFEMDQRFFGHVGEYLEKVEKFARNEPRKQALERATFPFRQCEYDSYDEFVNRVDRANKGQSRAWGPLQVPDINPIGPDPPTSDPRDEFFKWGVGEDADVIVSSFCREVAGSRWVFGDLIEGFRLGLNTPRWWCPPAVMRGSRRLLLKIHDAQLEKNLMVPSEATLPSHALWHGLKFSYPPQPIYFQSQRHNPSCQDEISLPWIGGAPEHSLNGLGNTDPMDEADPGLTWWWRSTWTRTLMDTWLSGANDQENVLNLLAVEDGKIFMPNMAMHPVKSEQSHHPS